MNLGIMQRDTKMVYPMPFESHTPEPPSPLETYRFDTQASSPTGETEEFDLLSHEIMSVHGPALPDDNEDQIYDDWAGEVSRNRPEYAGFDEQNELEVNEMEGFTFDEQPQYHYDSDEQTEHDNAQDNILLQDEHEDLTEEQRRLAPGDEIEVQDPEAWWPWINREECLLDVMSAFPRSVFSEKELRATQWYTSKHGVTGLPSVRQVKNHRPHILNVAGVTTSIRTGKLGNLYAWNSFPEMFRHAFANPLVRRNLWTYSEDTGARIEEARQAERWRTEVDGNLAGPMARGDDGRDYFVEEPCMANIDQWGTPGPVMPMRWFIRDGAYWTQAHHLRISDDRTSFLIDARPEGCVELPLTAFFLTVVDLAIPECQALYGIPNPNAIAGILRNNNSDDSETRSDTDRPSEPTIEPWNLPAVNPWRTIANGRRVLSLPLWLYCDDTSGNTSKKWNKHNSILFTLAGLPRKYTQMIYNINFIATSNLAPPLEMMEAIADVLEEARQDGIEVWDCRYGDMVLLIPWVLAFQGDNPMASEFASHVGMTGKCFCRVCHVRGADEKNRAPGVAGDIERLKDFITEAKLRSKGETVADLDAQLKRVLDGAPSAVDGMATDTGSKDKYFGHFVSQFQAAANKYKDQHKNIAPAGGMSKAEEVRNVLRKVRDTMPANIYNPVLRIADFDPNQDSPVEILHVVLLGIVKYWWRDAVSRQTSEGKEELKARLSSVDIAGLNISQLRGHTLVQYAGSLVGRDFRVILQVAPAVLHGLIPQSHYEGWLALCRLAPLVFQPVIEDLDIYKTKLEAAITDFLAATALWTTQWFNKPKFHLLVHLFWHIRRFGPAMIYATESFESYNLVIRLRSVHSPKHAPSIDIAHSFSHLHAVQHLVSGGWVLNDENGLPLPRPRQAGQQVLQLIQDDEFVQMMSMEGLREDTRVGHYVPLQSDALVDWKNTAAGNSGVPCLLASDTVALCCRSIVLVNGDRAAVGKFVIYQAGGEPSAISVGRVDEILVDPTKRSIVGVLVAPYEVGTTPILPYRFPACRVAQDSVPKLLAFKDVLAAVNTIHNCAANNCHVAQTRIVVQERQRTERTENQVEHSKNPDDLLLNLAQLRSAAYLEVFRLDTTYPGLLRDELIEEAVRHRHALERQAQLAKENKEKEKLEKAARKAAKKDKGKRRAEESSGTGTGPSKRSRGYLATTEHPPSPTVRTGSIFVADPPPNPSVASTSHQIADMMDTSPIE
ncbi:hypothetical protein PLICRDRAFT_693166 [Plicaturopsis crispa FD-325 SS-3]|nr:hypothetical protein PLICRDRAFT_693166 [Plicaturopsis crispa FD-325 SS-3]